MSFPTHPSTRQPDAVELDVRGNVPPLWSGRIVGIDRGGFVHSVDVHGGRLFHRSSRLRTDVAVRDVVAFGGAILAFGDDALTYDLSTALDTLHRVDLAGRGRTLAAHPTSDPATGELHLVARAADGAQEHVVVSAGALTRHSRAIPDPPSRIDHLALTRDHVVFLAHDVAGVARRDGEARTTWIATHVVRPAPVHARDVADSVVLVVLTPSLERWTLRAGAGSIRREVLDPTPRRFARCGGLGTDAAPRVVWTTGNGTVGHHDLAQGRHVHHRLRAGMPGDLVFIAEATPGRTRESDTDRGWLVGFVHDAASAAAELRIIDAAQIASPAIATARIPRPIACGLRFTWIPRPSPDHPSQSAPAKENRP